MRIIYQDENLIAVDKPAGIVVYSETNKDGSLIELLAKEYPEIKSCGAFPRYGIAHRLDKETSGVILVAKNNKTLSLLQEQFKKGLAEKIYIALVVGKIELDQGKIETGIGRSPKDRKRQKAFSLMEKGKRTATTEYKALKRFNDYTLVEAYPKTGRKHQIRCQFSYINHPIAGDRVYGFKNQPLPEGLKRHFLHARSIKILGKEFSSEIPEDLKDIINNLEKENYGK